MQIKEIILMNIFKLFLILILLNVAGCSDSNIPKTKLNRKTKLHPKMAICYDPDNDLRKSPAELIINGVKVFEPNGDFISQNSEYLKVDIFEDKTAFMADYDYMQEGKFQNKNDIQWVPFRSSHLPNYFFKGKWELNDNGSLKIYGKYESREKKAKPPPPYDCGKIHFTVYKATISKKQGPTYKYQIRLWVTKDQ